MNTNSSGIFLKAKIIILVLFVSTEVFGKVLPPQTLRLGYGSINPAEVDATLNCVFPAAGATDHYDRHVENFIVLGVDYDCPTYVAAADVSVYLEIKYYDEDNNLMSSSFQTLNIEYKTDGTNAKDKRILIHEGAYRIWVKIISITGGSVADELPVNMYLETQIVIERFYDFNDAAGTPISQVGMIISAGNFECSTDNTINDYLHVEWPMVLEAEEYDLEWTFINDYDNDDNGATWLDVSTNKFRFRNNSTRITTVENSFDVPLIFDHGYIAFRVRAVGRKFTDVTIPVFGIWNEEDEPIFTAVHANAIYYNEEIYHAKMNWQLTTTFAEEGKHKEVVSFFDGTFRNRQTVTRLSSTGVAVVGESIYDFHGRPAIQVLPVPVGLDACSGIETSIHYYSDFNLVDELEPVSIYTALNFDQDSDDCAIASPGMSPTSGASKYYSPNNTYLSSGTENAYIPNANLYPFSQVEYTPDNTGRIRRQGGVGAEFQLNSGHETNYLYGMPHQIQLDRLFGSEVGYYQHYKKNLVVDPNGQVSVSYMDMTDKVIATALAGPAPAGGILEAIPSSEDENNINTFTSALINAEASNPGSNLQVDESLIFEYQLLVPYASHYTFNYDLEVDPYKDVCFQSACLHCIYDLSISIIDDCGQVIWPTETDNVKPLVGRFAGTPEAPEFVTACSETEVYDYEKEFTIENLGIGEYTIRKELRVNAEARNFYVEHFLEDETSECVYDLPYFVNGFLNGLPVEDCAIEFNCEVCLEQLGDRDAFIATGPYDFVTNALLFDWQYEECVRECTPLTSCSVGFDMMVADVSKGGQYGKFEVAIGGGEFSVNPEVYELSVFNEDNLLPKNSLSSPANWRNPSIILNGVSYPYYLESDGTRSKIHVLQTLTGYLPEVLNSSELFQDENSEWYCYPENLLSVEDFLIGFWNSNWSRSLVTYHPEYCYYEACKEYNARQTPADYLTSDQFDELLTQTLTLADAYEFELVTSSYLPTDWFQDAPSGAWPFNTDDDDFPYDPFVVRGNATGEIFSGDGTPYFFGDQLEERFYNYSSTTTPISMVAMAAYTVLSQVEPSNPILNSTDPTDWEAIFGANIGDAVDYTANKNAMWNALTSLYLGTKRELQSERNNNYAIYECAGYNGCMGNSGAGNYAVDFAASSSLAIYADQPCNPETRLLYANSIPRFASGEQIASTVPEGYGQCDTELNLQNLFNALIEDGVFASSAIALENYSAFNAVYANASIVSPAYPGDLNWNTTTTGSVIEIELISDSEVFCELSIDSDELTFDWADLYYVSNLTFVDANTFEITIYYWVDGDLTYKTMTGESECLEPCPSITESNGCETNTLIVDLLALMNAIVDSNSTGLLASNLTLAPTYSSYLTSAIMNYFEGSSLSDIKWTCGGTNFYLEAIGHPNPIYLDFYINYSSIIGNIDEIVSIDCRYDLPAPLESGIQIDCIDDSGNPITLYSDGNEEGKTIFCNCIEPAAICCQGQGYKEFQHVKSYVEELVSDAGVVPGYLLAPDVYSPTLSDYIHSDNDYIYSLTETTFNGIDVELVEFDGEFCDLVIYMNDDQTGILNMPDLQNVMTSNFHVTGTPDDNGNYYSFSFSFLGFDFFGSWCIPMKECPYTGPCGSVVPIEPITFTPDDPCVDQLTQNANNNGQYAYEQWVAEFTGELAEAYTAHCLNNVRENFSTTFDDREYHYTLYYYDQSGNLVRTVPPAGVKPLPINSSFSELAQHIDEDRVSGQRRIYTFHNLATTYTYNSLNQLVHQSLPDHDKMKIWETSLPFGVQNGFEANEIQFASAANGFMGGLYEHNYPWGPLTTSPLKKIERGLLYETNDGGSAWKKVDGLVNSDLVKMEMISHGLGYAIGNDGIFLRTRDGGNSWDMLVTYHAFDTHTPVHFTDFASNVNRTSSTLSGSYSSGTAALLIVGLDGIMIRVTYLSTLEEKFERIVSPVFNYGEAADIVPSFTSEGEKWDFSSVECSGNYFNIWVNFPGGFENEGFSIPLRTFCAPWSGSPFLATNVNSLVFDCDSYIRAADLKTNHMYAAQASFAGGNAGRLFHCSNLHESTGVHAQWYQVPTNIIFDFKKLYFYNSRFGLAIVNEIPSGGVSSGAIYSTEDSGRTWTRLSMGNLVFNDLYGYNTDPHCAGTLTFNGCRVFAVGSAGKIARITIVANANNSGIGIEYITSPTTNDLNACWAEVVKECGGGSDHLIRYFITGNGGKIYTCLTYGYSQIFNWQEITSGATENFIDLEISANGTTETYPQLSGILQTSTGAVHTLFIAEGPPDCAGADASCNTSTLCPNHCPSDYVVAPVTGWPTTTPIISKIFRVFGDASAEDLVFALSQTLTGSAYTYELHRFDLSGAVASPIAISMADVATDDEHPFSSCSARIDGTEIKINMVGRNGFNHCLVTTISSTSTSLSNDDRYAVRPLPNIKTSISTQSFWSGTDAGNGSQPMAVGKNGTLLIRRHSWSTNAINRSWDLFDTGIVEDITAITAIRSTGVSPYSYVGERFQVGILGTENGKFVKWSIDRYSGITYNLQPGVIFEYLDSIKFESIGNVHKRINSISSQYIGVSYAYAVGDDGLICRITLGGSTYVPLTPTITTLAVGDVDYKSISCFYDFPNAVFLCGANGRIEKIVGTSRTICNDIFIPRIEDVHFINSAEGYVICGGFTLRHTIDGGNSWQVVLPSASLGPNLPTLNKVVTKNLGLAFAVGNTSANLPYILRLDNNIANVESTSGITNVGNSTLMDVQFDANGTMWMVGKSNNIASIFHKASGTSSWTQTNYSTSSSTALFKGLHIFPSNNAIAVCGFYNSSGIDHPIVNVFENGAWKIHTDYFDNLLTGFVLNDIFFHDDVVGYVVGSYGKLYKTSSDMTLPEYDTSGLLEMADAFDWISMDINPTVFTSQSNLTNTDLRTIAFSNRWEGLWGGSYNQTSIPRGYVRNVIDESEIFSTRFWYDRLGRITASQNTKQLEYDIPRYSYTLYDQLGRVVEAGEKEENTASYKFKEIFGSWVEGYYNKRTIEDTKRNTWIAETSGNRYEVTKSYYDNLSGINASLPAGFGDIEELYRKRISAVSYEEVYDASDITYDHATHYDYDIHGNVKTLIQDFPEMADLEVDQQLKRLDYKYDLISGNVKQVSYQAGKADQLYLCYEYDSDNRITDVYTSRQGWDMGETALLNCSMPGDWLPYFDHDAVYDYYLHGPLARVQIGDIKVQGIDYAYTLQGWLKGVNSNQLLPGNDIGQDGASGDNLLTGRDAMGFTLGYRLGDYASIGTSSFEISVPTGSDIEVERRDLWNGNIGHMVTALQAPPGSLGTTLPRTNLINGMAYRYDQLNRLTSAVGFENYDLVSNEWETATTTIVDRYRNTFTYDANGNILTQARYDEAGLQFEDLEYRYDLEEEEGDLTKDDEGIPLRNRLYHVNDNTSYTSLKTDDMDDQGVFDGTGIDGAMNYSYDAIGQLISDDAEELEEIVWRVDGKIKAIFRDDLGSKKELSFDYDAMGNRVAKHVYSSTGTLEKTTYYIRDAQGNVMSVYERLTVEETPSLLLTELHIYGSSRLGMISPVEMNQMIAAIDPEDTGMFSYERGLKQYELSNHLGNVLSVITDQKIVEAPTTGTLIEFYYAEVISYSDYYPFGAPMTERSWQGDYRYGFNGKEKENEHTSGNYDFGARILDTRLGRWFSVDPKSSLNSNISTYCFADNCPITMNDPDGQDAIIQISGNTITCKAQIFIYGAGATNQKAVEMQSQIMQYWGKDFTYMEGDKEYQVKFEIEVINVDINTGAEISNVVNCNDPLSWNGDENWVELQDESITEYRSNVDGNTGQNGKWGSDESAHTYAHEVGHFLGLDDLYIEYKSDPATVSLGTSTKDLDKTYVTAFKSAAPDELMATGNKVTQRDIDAIAKFALGANAKNPGQPIKLEASGMPFNKPTAEDTLPFSGNGHYIEVEHE